MTDDPWTDRLSEYLDGELTEAERTALERHLAACPGCSTTLADLSRVVLRAGALPAPKPQRDLWEGIAERIAAERGAPPARPAPSGGRQRRWSLAWPELAAAALAIAAGSGGVAWWAAGRAMAPPPVVAGEGGPTIVSPAVAGPATPRYDAAVADLQRVLAAGRGTLDSSTVRVLEQNLALIDRAIDDAQRALAADPGNTYLNAHLAHTMRRKLDLLRQAASLAAARS
jgi:anti-sigma factor RsiW